MGIPSTMTSSEGTCIWADKPLPIEKGKGKDGLSQLHHDGCQAAGNSRKKTATHQ